MSDLLSRELREVLRAIGDEKVYRSAGGYIMRQVRAGQNRRCDRAVRELMFRGLATDPPLGCSFFMLTDEAEVHLKPGEHKCIGYARHVECPLGAEAGDVYCTGCREAVEEYRAAGYNPDDVGRAMVRGRRRPA